jgi:hypothetical protein
MDKWDTHDNNTDFNLIEFYHLIMVALSKEDDPWVIETMAWWRMYVPNT